MLNASRQVGGALAVTVIGAPLSGPGGFLAGLRISLVITAEATLAAPAAASLLHGQKSPAG